MVLKYLISIAFVLVGAWMLYRAFGPRLKAKAASAWPSTTAQILETGTREDHMRTATGNVSLAFIPTVKYTYTVESKSYDGDRITYSNVGFDFITASSVCDQFKPGTQTQVSYNPANPAESVLRPRSTVGMFSRIPGFFMLIVGLGLMAYLLLV